MKVSITTCLCVDSRLNQFTTIFVNLKSCDFVKMTTTNYYDMSFVQTDFFTVVLLHCVFKNL